MTKSEIQFYRERLLYLLKRFNKDRSQLKSEALATTGGEASGGLSDVPIHLADLGSHQFEEDVSLDLLENEERLVEEVNGGHGELISPSPCSGGGVTRATNLPFSNHTVRKEPREGVFV